jgi:hypothetical protein
MIIEMRFFLRILLIFFLGSGLKAQAGYTCAEALTLTNKKIRVVKKEIFDLKQNPNKNSSSIQKIKSINNLMLSTYKLTQKSRVGEGFTKYSPEEWQEHNPSELIANIQVLDQKALNDELIALNFVKNKLINYQTDDVLCSFQMHDNPWIESLDLSNQGKFGPILDKFILFVNRNLSILDELPTSPALIKDEFRGEPFTKVQLKIVVKQEVKNRRLLVRRLTRIYRSTKKLS